MLSVKSSGYRFPGFFHMYGALASLVYATYISFSLSACFRCQPSIYVLLVRTISFLLLFLCLLFSGSTGLFCLFLFFCFFNFRWFICVLSFLVFSSPYLINLSFFRTSSISYLLKILSFDPNIQLFSEGTLGWILRIYFGDDASFGRLLDSVSLLGGSSSFYISVGTDVGYINLIAVYSVFSILFFYFILFYLVYTLRHTEWFRFSLFLLATCILFNFKEVLFLSSPGPFRLILMLSISSIPRFLPSKPLFSSHSP